MTRIIIFLALGLTAWLILTSPQQLHAIFDKYTTAKEEVVDSNQQGIAEQAEFKSSVIDESDVKAEIEVAEKTVVEEGDANTDPSSSPDSTIESEQPVVDSVSKDDIAKSESATIESAPSESELPAKTQISPIEKNSLATTPQTLPNHFNSWPASNQFGMMNPMANAQYMQYMQMMNPMFNMMAPMMSMMGPMMNPGMFMNPMGMMQHPMNTMTQPQNMNAMMMSMDPKLMFSMFGQPSKEYQEGEVPDQLPVVTIPGFPTQTYQNWPKNKVSPGVSREAKKNAFQTAMAMSPLSMRDMMGIMADKIPVEEGVTWDDAVEAMKLRANEVNFKFVGSSPLWKQIEAETEEPSAKVEMFRFCDATLARKILDVVPEFIIFLPCKIALLEDGEGKLWVMTMDWDISWMDFAQNPNSHLSKEIREDAQRIRDNLNYIMEGAATGDF